MLKVSIIVVDYKNGLGTRRTSVTHEVLPERAEPRAYLLALEDLAETALRNTDLSLEDLKAAMQEAAASYVYSEGEKDREETQNETRI